MTETTNEAATPKPTVVEAWSLVQADVLVIEKGKQNREQGFWFRGIDDVMNRVGPILRQHGVVVLPTAEEITTERYISKGGAHMQAAIVRMRYTVHGPAGDTLTGSTYGQAADAGDKAVSKAESVAYRVFLLQGLTIPTHEADPDASTHERSGSTPKQQVAQDVTPAQAARDELAALITRLDIGRDEAMERFAADNDGLDIIACRDPKPIQELTARYREQFADRLAATAADN